MAQLHKDSTRGMFCGVCAGISNVTGIDVTLVRIATIFGSIFTGSLIFWIYLLLAIILPKKV